MYQTGDDTVRQLINYDVKSDIQMSEKYTRIIKAREMRHVQPIIPYYQMFQLVKGAASLKLKDKTVNISKVYLLEPGAIYNLQTEDKDTEINVISFSLARNSESGIENQIAFRNFLFDSEDEGYDIETTLPSVLYELKNVEDKVASCCEKIMEEMLSELKDSTLMCQTCLIQMIIWVVRGFNRNLMNKKIVLHGDVNQLMNLGRSYLINDFDKRNAIQEAAGKLYMTGPYFSRMFKELYGITPISYLLQLRAVRACELLLNTDSKVNAIGTDIGYPYVQRFNTIFRELMGTTPAEYRKNNSGLNMDPVYDYFKNIKVGEDSDC